MCWSFLCLKEEGKGTKYNGVCVGGGGDDSHCPVGSGTEKVGGKFAFAAFPPQVLGGEKIEALDELDGTAGRPAVKHLWY